MTKSAGVKRRTVASDYFARLPAMKELADTRPVLQQEGSAEQTSQADSMPEKPLHPSPCGQGRLPF